MAAKAWSTTSAKVADEVFFSNSAVSLCLLVNRRAKTMRVVDFRAGPSDQKRAEVLKLAKREGVEKVYTLVERDEVSTWTKMGFTREGSIPCFYKRSDAFLLGCPANLPVASETRLVTARPRLVDEYGFFGGGDDDDDDVTPEPVGQSPAALRAERTVHAAKKLVKDWADRALPVVKIADVPEERARKLVDKATKATPVLSAFEPFGRGADRRFFAITAKGGFESIASVESQSCFGNGFFEMLAAPKTDPEALATTSAVRAMCEKLIAEGTVSCFSLAPSDDVKLSAAFASNGFRRTGLLLSHLLVGKERKDAILWSRKLANPAGE